MNSKISEKDKKTWNEFLSSDQKLQDKDNLQIKTNVKKIRSLDLHGKGLDEANQILNNLKEQPLSSPLKISLKERIIPYYTQK